MGIFDNAKSITFNDKEVKSITVDGGVIYEADEPIGGDVTLKFPSHYTGMSVAIDGESYVTDSNGECTVSLANGTHTLQISESCFDTIDSQPTQGSQTAEITVTDDHKEFVITLTACTQ